MRKIKYPLVVSDFDGTLVRADGTIGEKTKSAIEKYIKMGGTFAISTGRMPMGILSRARELGLQGAVSCFQGAVIMDIQTGKVISDGRMDNQIAVQISKKMDELGVHIHVYDLIDYYTNRENETEKFYVRCVDRKGVFKENMTDFLRETGLCPYKLIALTEKKDSEHVYTELEKCFGKTCHVTTSGAEEYVFVEVCNPKYTKGTALAFLADYYKVPLVKTVGVGDQRNDLSMIKAAGVGAAVGNAHPDLKAQAKIVLDQTNEQDAVGVLIEKYAYEEIEE